MRAGVLVLLLTASTATARPLDADELRHAARSLAREGRCDEVREVARRVEALDAELFAARFVTDDEIRRCGTFVIAPDTPAVRDVPPPHRAGRSFRPWLIAIDVSAMVAAAAFARDGEASEHVREIAAASAYLLVSPLARLIAGDSSGALRSLVARAALPVSLALTFSSVAGVIAVARSRGDFLAYLETDTDALVAGAALGMLAACAYDGAVLPAITRHTVGVAVAF